MLAAVEGAKGAKDDTDDTDDSDEDGKDEDHEDDDGDDGPPSCATDTDCTKHLKGATCGSDKKCEAAACETDAQCQEIDNSYLCKDKQCFPQGHDGQGCTP